MDTTMPQFINLIQAGGAGAFLPDGKLYMIEAYNFPNTYIKPNKDVPDLPDSYRDPFMQLRIGDWVLSLCWRCSGTCLSGETPTWRTTTSSNPPSPRSKIRADLTFPAGSLRPTLKDSFLCQMKWPTTTDNYLDCCCLKSLAFFLYWASSSRVTILQ